MIDFLARHFYIYLFRKISRNKKIVFVPNSSVCIYHETSNLLDVELPPINDSFFIIQYYTKKEIHEYKGYDGSVFFEEDRKNSSSIEWFGLARWNKYQECFVVNTNKGLKRIEQLKDEHVWFNCLTSHKMKTKNLMSERQAHLQAIENY